VIDRLPLGLLRDMYAGVTATVPLWVRGCVVGRRPAQVAELHALDAFARRMFRRFHVAMH